MGKIYSQNNEDAIVSDYFGGATGNLLDIGAYDGESFSNSRRLLMAGWSGALVEPLPGCAEKCRALYHDNPRVSVVEAAIGPDARRVKFHVSEMMSTIDHTFELHRKKWHNLNFGEIEVEQITFADLLARVGVKFDFITIDVENYNVDIVRQIPAAVWAGARCLCIEHDGHTAEIERTAQSHGFRRIAWNAENIIVVR